MNITQRGFGFLMGKRLPVLSGQVKVSGLHASLKISRDEYAIPYISAANEEDAWFGLGFCQGQDRCFQIEASARVARGTAAELFGKKVVAIDRLSRRFGIYRSAEAQWACMEPEQRKNLEAFAAGLNAGVTKGLQKKPHEYTLLRSTPTTFTGLDPLAILIMMSIFLPSNWDSELTRLKVLQEDGPEALFAVDHSILSHSNDLNLKSLSVNNDLLESLQSEIAVVQKYLGVSGGSNNWAIHGDLTDTGRPILANDPHLGPLLPCYWYLSHLSTPEWKVAGASLAGTLGIAVGHNEKAAWGVTAGMVDNADLFIEEISPDKKTVRGPKGREPCQEFTEVIKVRGGEDVLEKVVVTPRGPIISSSIGETKLSLSLQATWLQPRPLNGMLQLHRVQSFEELQSAFAIWAALPLNMVYADTDGNIGYVLVGNAPVRKSGKGMMPLPAWQENVGWEADLLKSEDMPWIKNPAKGFVGSANTNPPVEKYAGFLTADWYDSYRFNRLWEVLSEPGKKSFAGSKQLQLDELSLPWRAAKVPLLAALTNQPEFSDLQKLLENWNGAMSADSSAATLFACFLCEASETVAKIKAPKSADWVLGQGYARKLVPYNMFGCCRVGWIVKLICDQPPDFVPGGWNPLILASFKKAHERVISQCGPDTADWQWGKARPFELFHPMGEVPLLKAIFNRGPFASGGDGHTLSQMAVPPGDPFGRPIALANLRMVIDVGNWDKARFVLAGGQSGNPMSPHYDDLLGLWLKGEGVGIAFSPEAVQAAVLTYLKLEPDV